MPQFFHDYETFCELDIKVVGAEAYCRHPSFEILMCSYAMEDDPVKLWVPAEGEPMPQEFYDAHMDPTVLLSGFNVGFEKAVTREGLGHIIPTIPAGRYRCTMAKAYGLSFSGGLDDVGKQIGIPQDKQKLDIGKRLIQRFCKPAPKNHKAVRYDRFTHPQEWEDFKGYCVTDSESERYISRWLDAYTPLSDFEWLVWSLDQEINQNGLPVSLITAQAALDLHQEAKTALLHEMNAVTGLPNANSTQQLGEWLRARHGVVMPNFQAQTIKDTIKLGAIPQEALTVLDMKRRVGMTAPTKWKAFLDKACPDWVLRGMFTYGGASRTRRWASRGINLQNLKSPPFSDMEAAVWFIQNQDLGLIQAVYGDPIEFLAGTVRGGITAPDGEILAVSDLGSIESRVVGWISGCRAINDTFAQGLDTYKVMAVDIYGVAYELVTGSQRKFAKPVVLAGPYGQGWKGLIAYAENFGVELSEEEAKRHINTFRTKCWEIPQMWKWLEAAIQDAVLNGGRWDGYKVSIYTEGEFLFIQLPSGRRLAYHQPKIEMKKTPWDEVKPTFTYMGNDKDKPVWVRLKAHAGLIVENIVQAIARDILVCGLMNAKAAGMTIIGHVHDEIITRVPEAYQNEWLKVLEDAMCIVPEWAPGLLLDADGFCTKNYRKD